MSVSKILLLFSLLTLHIQKYILLYITYILYILQILLHVISNLLLHILGFLPYVHTCKYMLSKNRINLYCARVTFSPFNTLLFTSFHVN